MKQAYRDGYAGRNEQRYRGDIALYAEWMRGQRDACCKGCKARKFRLFRR